LPLLLVFGTVRDGHDQRGRAGARLWPACDRL